MSGHAAKVWIDHGNPCRCRILDGAIYVGAPCRRYGHKVTRRRVAQLIYNIERVRDAKSKT